MGSSHDPSGNISYTPAPLWSGVDDAASNYGVLDITLDDAGVYLLNGLMILTDIDHSYFWEQIDAVELIGTAVPETYRPQSPSLDDVAGDNVVNFDEKESVFLSLETMTTTAPLILSSAGVILCLWLNLIPRRGFGGLIWRLMTSPLTLIAPP